MRTYPLDYTVPAVPDLRVEAKDLDVQVSNFRFVLDNGSVDSNPKLGVLCLESIVDRAQRMIDILTEERV